MLETTCLMAQCPKYWEADDIMEMLESLFAEAGTEFKFGVNSGDI